MYIAILSLLLATAAPAPAAPQPPITLDSGKALYRIAISRSTVADTTTLDTLKVTLRSQHIELAAFDMKIGTDRPDVEIIQILPGSFYDTCHWEFFNAKSVPTTPNESQPTSLWQAVVISETIPDDTAPACYSIDGEAELLQVIVAIKRGHAAATAPAPIFFYWEDCTDNTISTRSGDTLAISGKIVDYFDVHLPSTGDVFPTRMGTPRQCITPGLPNRPRRIIDFYNGGLEFRRITPDTTTADSGKTAR